MFFISSLRLNRGTKRNTATIIFTDVNVCKKINYIKITGRYTFNIDSILFINPHKIERHNVSLSDYPKSDIIDNLSPGKGRGASCFCRVRQARRDRARQRCALPIAARICSGGASPAKTVMVSGEAFSTGITIRPGVPVSPSACASASFFSRTGAWSMTFSVSTPAA